MDYGGFEDQPVQIQTWRAKLARSWKIFCGWLTRQIAKSEYLSAMLLEDPKPVDPKLYVVMGVEVYKALRDAAESWEKAKLEAGKPLILNEDTSGTAGCASWCISCRHAGCSGTACTCDSFIKGRRTWKETKI